MTIGGSHDHWWVTWSLVGHMIIGGSHDHWWITQWSKTRGTESLRSMTHTHTHAHMHAHMHTRMHTHTHTRGERFLLLIYVLSPFESQVSSIDIESSKLCVHMHWNKVLILRSQNEKSSLHNFHNFHWHNTKNTQTLASFPGPTQLSVTCSFRTAGPGNEAT